MKLLFRPKPLYMECLSSYIQRIAAANFVKPHELWRIALPLGAHYPQSSISSTIDTYPYSMLDVEEIKTLLGLEFGIIEALTYIPINKKLGQNDNRIKNSRVLSGLFEKYRRFCPSCLNEKKYYKLIWQV